MKNTKKSMFITTVLMVAVLIVAVSTATFAWYTTNNNATAGSTTITAANSDSFNIAVGWNSTDTGNLIEDLAPATDELKPAVPSAAFSDSVDYETAIESFYNAGINAAGKFTGVGVTESPWVVNHTDPTQNFFYVINNNMSTNMDVVMTLVVDQSVNALADQLFVAVYTGDDYAGVLNVNANTYTYGTVAAGGIANPAVDGSVLETAAATKTLTFGLNANTNTEIRLIAWLDGPTTLDANAGQKVQFSFHFAAKARA